MSNDTKLSKKYLGQNVVGAEQIQLEHGTAIRSRSADGTTEVEILKVNDDDMIEFLQSPVVPYAPTQDNQLVRKIDLDLVEQGLDLEIQEVRSEVVAEGQRALSAEGLLDEKVDQEIEDRIAGDAELQLEIDAEKVRAMAAESTLQDAINAEELLRASEDVRILSESKTYTNAEVLIEKNRAMAAEASIQSELTAIDSYVDATFITLASKGQPNGVATLNGSGLIPETQLPSYVDDVLEFQTLSVFPALGETGKIYVDITTSKTYRWSGSVYVQITSGAVDTVFGRLGIITAQAGDYSADQVSYGTGFVSDELVSLQSEIDAEETRALAAEQALSNRLSPIEEIFEFKKEVAYENNAQVFADGQPGLEDAQLRDGWYYQNTVAGQKINWYFFDGVNQANIALGDFSAYSVMTFDSSASSPILSVYTMPTGSSDVIPGFAHSKLAYGNLAMTPVVGKKYLVYFGQNPTIHPELPRIQLSLSVGASAGDMNPLERVSTTSFGSNSSAAVNTVKFMVESLGIYSPDFKGEAELRIRKASLKSLESSIETEETRAVAAELILRNDISSGVLALTASDLTEKNRAMAAESALDALIFEETSARMAADNLEKQRAIKEEEALLLKIEGEKEERIASDEEMEALIAIEAQRATLAEMSLQNEISTESASRASEDTRILSEAKAYVDAKALTEKNRAEGIEDGLQTEIDSLETYVDATFITLASKGQSLGVATLNESGLIPESQLPSYVDDVLEFSELATFPALGESGKIYVDISTAKTYRWSGSTYVAITSGAVDTVFGRNGVITAQSGDYSASQITYGMGSVADALASIESEVGAEETRASAAESLLQDNIDSEETRALAAEALLDTAIESEEIRAMGVEANLQSDITDLQTDTSSLDLRVSVLESRDVVFEIEIKVLTAMDISNGYFDLSFDYFEKSLRIGVGERVNLYQGLDYTATKAGMVTRVTITGPSASTGGQSLVEGQTLYIGGAART